jgi:type IV pilus assembly protein PilC
VTEFDDRATTDKRDSVEDTDGALGDAALATITQSIEAAADNQLPIEITLAMLAEEAGDRRLARVAHRLADQLEQGTPIPEAFKQLDGELPPELGGLLRAGIDSGNLASAISEFSRQRLETQRLRWRIRAVLAYPLIVLAIVVPLALFLSMYVIPMFKEIFEEFDLGLPIATELILQAAEQLPGFLIGATLFFFGVPIFLRLVGGRWLFHRVRGAVPLLGPIWTFAGQREFAASLASFIKLRVPLDDAVTYTGNSIGDRNVGRACRRVTKRLENGDSLSESLGESLYFDRALVALVAWGEAQGLLPESLLLATHVFDDRVEQYATLLRRLLPPITFIVVATVMFYVVVALFIPLVSLIQNLSM